MTAGGRVCGNSHLPIIAAAGSGKTEVVSQRVVSLPGDGVPAPGIVAFELNAFLAREGRLMGVKNLDYSPNPGTKCRKCEVRSVCGSAKR